MKKFVLVLLFLPMLAMAEHHRGHALDNIEPMYVHFTQLQKHLNIFQISCTLDADAQASVDVIFLYTDKMVSDLGNAENAINAGLLDDARRVLTQPNNDGALSVAVRMTGIVQRARMLIDTCPEHNDSIARVLARMSWAWSLLDKAIWHVHDAVREEIYFDPEFICSGPNNHCE
jgi:hypothetical protein